MKKFAAIAAASAVAAIGLAAPAQAYDRELYAFAAGHMIGANDVPASLNVKKGGDFGAFPSGKTNFLCGDADKQVNYPGGDHQFNMNYDGRKGGTGISVNVTQYASAQKAIRAFNDLKKGLKECEGPASGQQTFDDGSTDSWSRLNTTGNVPLVTVAGVQSVFLNENYEDVTTGEGAGTYSSDSYSVYTLVNDVIINTSRYTGSELNMSTRERRAVNQVAFNAVTRWVG
jgi:hypothetical protein